MNKTEKLKTHLIDYVESITARSEKAKTNYNCPLCGSGTGQHRTGAFMVMRDGMRWKCFACGSTGDLFDLIAEYEKISLSDAFKRAWQMYGTTSAPVIHNRTTSHKERTAQASNIYTAKDLHQFAEAIQKPDCAGMQYLMKRGFSSAIVKNYGIGFDGKNIVIPYQDGNGYFLRGVHGDFKGKRGKQEIYNCAVLKSAFPVVVVEGQLDALAVIQAGGQAVGLGSVNNAPLLLQYIDRQQPRCKLILCLDNDEAGQRAQEELKKELQARPVEFCAVNLSGAFKDPAERLQCDAEGLRQAIKAIYKS